MNTRKEAGHQLALGLMLPEVQEGDTHIRLQTAAAVLGLLGDWHAAGWIRELDLRFARFLHTEQTDAPGLLLLAAALASHQLGRGHVCLDLAATLSGPERVLDLPPEFRLQTSEHRLITPAELLGRLSLTDWEAALQSAMVSDGSRVTPLVYDGGRLYLYRYWRYEQQVAIGIASRLRPQTRPPVGGDGNMSVVLPQVQQWEEGDAGASPAAVRPIVDILFQPPEVAAGPDWQRLACALAARSSFAVITGGPGTGKTTTVLRLLALLQALHYQSHGGKGAPLRIQLAAPTGKAAARLSESIAGKVNELPLSRLPGGTALAGAIPTEVVTLHRLLGGRPHTQARRYNVDNPLPLDVLVIDEASMVALSDMAHVMAALPPFARLVLIGDKDQLSSVEAGAVLGELCRHAEQGRYVPATAQWLEQATGMPLPSQVVDSTGNVLDQAVAMLRVSYRFGPHSGIGRLAAAVNEGKIEEARRLLQAPPADLSYLRVSDSPGAAFARLVIDGHWRSASVQPNVAAKANETPVLHGYGHYLALASRPPESGDQQVRDEWAAKVLHAQRGCQVLCVLRSGPFGVVGLNAAISRLLHQHGLIPAISGWYVGRPVMVTRNNPALRLTNGDIGVVLPYPSASAGEPALRVAFPDADGKGVRWFAPNRLDDVETVYALTVHKSQGSEFQHTILVLPPAPTPILTRELLYTGITRASHWFTLVDPGGPGLLRHAISQRVYRSGGLGKVLEAQQ